MSPTKTPLQIVNEKHGGKEKLVEKIMGIIERGEEDASELKARLLSASNTKLLKLAETYQTIKDKYGSRDKLVEAVAKMMNKAKDADYRKRLETYTSGRLLDMAKTMGRRVGAVAEKAKTVAKETKAKASSRAKKPAKS